MFILSAIMTTLLDKTLTMASQTHLPVAQICRDIGVTPRWYHKVVSGQIPDPSVRRIQRLHDYLAANEGVTASEPAPAEQHAQGAA